MMSEKSRLGTELLALHVTPLLANLGLDTFYHFYINNPHFLTLAPRNHSQTTQ